MKRLVQLAIFCLLGFGTLSSQDIHFSQFYASPMTLNPAMTGMMNGCYRGAVNFKNQWAAIPAPYTTVAASYDMPLLRGVIGSDYIGVGFLIFNDQAGYGDLNNLTAMASLAYHKAFDSDARYVLSLGGQAGLVHKSVDFSQLIFEQQIIQATGSGLTAEQFNNWEQVEENAFNYFDVRVGGMLTLSPTNQFTVFLGGSVYHLTEPGETFLNSATNFLDQRQVFHLGATIKPNKSFSIAPNAIYMTQATAEEIVVGANFGYHFNDGLSDNTAIFFGASYRFDDAVIPLVGIEYNDFKFGLSYDITVSELAQAASGQGGIELSMVFESFCSPPGRRSYPPVHCPRF